MKPKLEILILVIVTVVLCCAQTSYTAPTRYGKFHVLLYYNYILHVYKLVLDYGQVLSVSAENMLSDSKVDSSMIAKLLQEVLSSAQGSPVKLPLTLPSQIQDQGQANKQMKALVEATEEQMMVDNHTSKEELEKALQQLFDMPSFPIIRLYPNDG